MPFQLGRGDLLVTGGKAQREWEHCVPKVARAGPSKPDSGRSNIPVRSTTNCCLESTRRARRPNKGIAPRSLAPNPHKSILNRAFPWFPSPLLPHR